MNFYIEIDENNVKVRELTDMYLKHAQKELRPNSLRLYMGASAKVNEAFGNRSIGAIKYKDVSKWHMGMSLKTPKMANMCLTTLSNAYMFAARMGLVDPSANPCSHVHRAPTKARTRYLSQEEIGNFIKATYSIEESRVEFARSKNAHQTYRLTARCLLAKSMTRAIRMILYTGCRKTEIMTAKKENLNLFEGGMALYLPSTKTRPRVVALPKVAVKELESFLKKIESIKEIRDSEYLFPSPLDHTKHVRSLKKTWAQICEITGFNNTCIRDLRRTFATQAILAGCHFSDVAVQLGHESDQMTRKVYANLVVSPLARVVADRTGAHMEKMFKK